MGGSGEGGGGGVRGARTLSSASHGSWGGRSSLGGFGGGGGGSQPPQPPHECIVKVKARPYSPGDDVKPRRAAEPPEVAVFNGADSGGVGGVDAGAFAAGGTPSR